MNNISVTHFLTDQCSGDVYAWSGSTTTDARLWSDAALSRARLVGAIPVKIFYSDGGDTFLSSGTVDVDLDWVGTSTLTKEVTDSGEGFDVNTSRPAAASGSVALRSDANIASGESGRAELTYSHLLLP